MVEGRHRLTLAALVAALVLAAAGCAPTAPRAPDDERAPDAGAAPAPAGGLSAAGSALLAQSRSERRAGDYAQASATLERALRIEPAAAVIWLELARLRLLAGDLAQAEQLARKAESLADRESALAEECRSVLAEALRRQGRGMETESFRPRG